MTEKSIIDQTVRGLIYIYPLLKGQEDKLREILTDQRVKIDKRRDKEQLNYLEYYANLRR